MKKMLAVILLTLVLTATVYAAEEASEAETQINDMIDGITNLVKNIATAIAALVLVYAGVVFMTSGNDPMKRNQAKNIAMGAILGLIVIQAAQPVASYVFGL